MANSEDAETTKPGTGAESEKSPGQTAMEAAVAGLPLRSIGPAFMGGRIADIAVHPVRRSTWYVAVGSGGLWKTVNAGTTWEAVFENQPSYSIGCVSIDPNNPEVIWVGTGENVSGRHVAWGDGVYRSLNGGKTWERMGLKTSEHIGKILIDPRDSNVVFVAAEGALWSSGGERGLFKTSDGGQTWRNVLEIDENTGVTSVAFLPGNPDVLIAAAYQRRRTVAAFLSGGPQSGIHKSTDGGETWRKLGEGLPKGDMGKIGLAVTPADPNLVYATIEANKKERGFYRSTNQGESWEKRNEYISGGTGPHYYQEIEASPIDPKVVYQMDVFVNVTRDGGKTFSNHETGKEKHSDNHALWIDPDDGNHLLVGTDAGLYESFDDGISWRHFPNLPVSQFYRVALDNSLPFYNVMGGAQDLGTLLGPSRTTNRDGVRNQDWWVPLGADGYHVAFDPDDPKTFYLEWQNGNVMRYDLRKMEIADIKPQPEPGEAPERWNWDSPILVSPHHSRRIYVGSQRVWRTDDRGNSWTAISDDLTKNRNRYELKMLGRVWSVDDLYDHEAMSQYSTISNLTESPVMEGVLYAGTDDGLVQVTEDGGKTWRQAGAMPGLPDDSFINDVEASRHDANVIYAAADAHKIGDYSPYVYASSDRGRTWNSIRGDLPDGTTVWSIEQDHVNPNLLFLGTEFGIYFTPNHGENWYKFSSGVPTISFREIKIHRRDDDLVGASFGRGFYVLDDYSALRTISPALLEEKAALFPVRDAWWYVPWQPMQSPGQPTLGSSAFRRENPPFGATFTYHVHADLKTAKAARQEAEKTLRDEGSDTPFPGWETLKAEARESEPQVFLLVRDADGKPVRRIAGASSKGLHRTSWDLRMSPPDPINLVKPDFISPWSSPPRGPLVEPGRYSVELVQVSASGVDVLVGAQEFEVKPLPAESQPEDFAAVVDFQQEVAELSRRMGGSGKEIERSKDRLRHIRAALLETPGADLSFFERWDGLSARLEDLNEQLNGDAVLSEKSEASAPSIRGRLGRVAWMHWDSTQLPSRTQKQDVAYAEEAYAEFQRALRLFIEVDLAQFEADLESAGAPWTPGRKLSG